MSETLEKCPVCKTELTIGGGIGPYCANHDCPVLDDHLLWNEDGTRKLGKEPIFIMKEDAELVELVAQTIAARVCERGNMRPPAWESYSEVNRENFRYVAVGILEKIREYKARG